MEEERRGGAADVKLMSLDSSDAAQQQDGSSAFVCVGPTQTQVGGVKKGQGHIRDITSLPGQDEESTLYKHVHRTSTVNETFHP